MATSKDVLFGAGSVAAIVAATWETLKFFGIESSKDIHIPKIRSRWMHFVFALLLFITSTGLSVSSLIAVNGWQGWVWLIVGSFGFLAVVVLFSLLTLRAVGFRTSAFLLQAISLLAALGVGKVVVELLALHYHLQTEWASPVWLLTTAAILACVALIARRSGVYPTHESALWDAVAEFSEAENPSGPWSYGWTRNPLSREFVLHTRKVIEALPGLSGWNSPEVQSDMCVIRNRTGNDLRGTTFLVPHDALVMHPGAGEIYDVVRWKCPRNGIYTISGEFRGLDDATHVADSDVNVIVNSRTSLFPQPRVLHGIGSRELITFSDISLSAGDTLDFVVGVGPSRSHGSDSTSLKVKIILQ